MRILICSLNFSPELTGIGKYTGEMAEWLAVRGHEVIVVCAPPYYPAWKVSEGFSGRRYARSVVEMGDGQLVVVRCPLWIPTSPTGAKRIVHLLSFALTSLPVLIFFALKRPQVVWAAAPSLFSSVGALLAARVAGAKAWLHIQDYEIDAAFDLGMLRGQGLRRFVLKCESLLLAAYDKVSTISNRMLDKGLGKGVPRDRMVLFPNWVDISRISPDLYCPDFRRSVGVPDSAVVALYSGNMGGKQGLEILAAAARLLADHSHIFFVFCGNGAGRGDLELACEGLVNVLFLPLQPIEKLGALLSMADIHLLPQRADAADLVMPSKLTGMLASGRPVVATAHPTTEVAAVVEGRGLVVMPEDPHAFSEAISRLSADSALRDRLGRAGRSYAEKFLHTDSVLSQFEHDLGRLIN